jgi:hypothetical protein
LSDRPLRALAIEAAEAQEHTLALRAVNEVVRPAFKRLLGRHGERAEGVAFISGDSAEMEVGLEDLLFRVTMSSPDQVRIRLVIGENRFSDEINSIEELGRWLQRMKI